MNTFPNHIVDESTGEVLCKVGQELTQDALYYLLYHMQAPNTFPVKSELPNINWRIRNNLVERSIDALGNDAFEDPEYVTILQNTRLAILTNFDDNADGFVPGQIVLASLQIDISWPFSVTATIYMVDINDRLVSAETKLDNIIILP